MNLYFQVANVYKLRNVPGGEVRTMAQHEIFGKVLGGLEEEIEMYLAKYGKEHRATQWLQEYHSTIADLKGKFPSGAEQLKGVDVRYKAKILKAELKSIFPDQRFSVRINRFSGGSAIHVGWEESPMLPEDEEQYHLIIEKYCYEYPDSNALMDYCHVDNFASGQGPSYKPPKK